MRKGLWKKCLIVGISLFLIGVNSCSVGKILQTSHAVDPPMKVSLLFTDSPDIEWLQQIGGNDLEIAVNSRQTSDGGFILVGGYSDESIYRQPLQLFQMNRDVSGQTLLMKTNANGEELWNKTLGGPSDTLNSCTSIEPATDGGYILAGTTDYYSDNPPSWDVWMVKTTSTGEHLWNTTFGTNEGSGNYMKKTSDNGFIISGGCADSTTQTNKVLLLKTDADGNEQWNRTYGSTSFHQIGYHVDTTQDGGYVIIGCRHTTDEEITVLIKTDNTGQQLWNKTFQLGEQTVGSCVEQTLDGGYILGGVIYTVEKYNQRQSYEAYLIKTDAIGDIQWTKTFAYAGIPTGGDSILQTPNGEFFIIGYKFITYPDTVDGWCLKIYANGNTKWEKTINHQTVDMFSSVLQTNDEGYLLTGGTSVSMNAPWDVLLVKLEPEEENQPPSPPTIEGPASGGYNIAHQWNFTATDPENDNIYYFVDWGDGTNTGWSLSYTSGETMPKSHQYNAKGTYTITAKAKDIHGLESDWGQLSVTMPYKPPQFPLLERILEQFPHAFPILRHLMGY